MKKIVAVAAICAVAVGFSACAVKPQNEELKVFAPDGAPALALAGAIAGEEAKQEEVFDIEIVSSDKITSFVTGANPQADVCILPVNAAAKALGTGTVYQMLGTVTNGNLYFLAAGEAAALTKETLKDELANKKVGVVQLANVPGLTLQVVLKDLGVPYQILQSVEETPEEGKAGLIAFTPDNVTPASGCDYYLCPEPAASAKVKGTASAPKPFRLVGDLQELYGGTSGYPQAVAVAKTAVIKERPEDVKAFVAYLENSASYLSTAEVGTVVGLIADKLEDGLSPSLNEKNLTSEVIGRCSVRFTASKDCKDGVKAFLDKLIAVNAQSTSAPADAFFYMG